MVLRIGRFRVFDCWSDRQGPVSFYLHVPFLTIRDWPTIRPEFRVRFGPFYPLAVRAGHVQILVGSLEY